VHYLQEHLEQVAGEALDGVIDGEDAHTGAVLDVRSGIDAESGVI